ncbi:MAG: hypothetical protein Ct9H300mP9_1300 [Candidatus Neomarinimicrobiota bacterium]|nr:MAG: hypothetical protein Ct9H300mP9_1300 [Candidatus Neomarinimicrobiota bacterium]
MFKASIILVTLLLTANAQEIFQSVRVWDPTPELIKLIAEQGIPMDHTIGKPGIFLDLTVSESESVALMSTGIDVEI